MRNSTVLASGVLLLHLLSGCASTSKIQKALDESYARGYDDASVIAKNTCGASMDLEMALSKKNEEMQSCQARLNYCLFGDDGLKRK